MFVCGCTRSQFLFSALLLTNVASALAQNVSSVFVSPSSPLTAGSRGSLWLLCMNNSSNEVSRTFELSLNCALTSASGPSKSVLWLNTNSSRITISIAPGGFIKEEYLLNVPPTISGQVRLDVSNYNQFAILVEAGSSGALAAVQTPPRLPKTKTARPLTEIINNNISSHLSLYEPVYFILGTYPAAEFQLSVKYQVFTFTNVNPVANTFDHFYVAYTQTSFWDTHLPEFTVFLRYQLQTIGILLLSRRSSGND